MEKLNTLDNGRDIDWGRTSQDYAKYRPGPPPIFYDSIKPFGIGLAAQKILDQGTGTGVVARQFARQGSEVMGTDISAEQVAMAAELAKQENLIVSFQVAPAELQPFADHSFDVITASQCHMYFDLTKWIPEVKRLLKPRGKVLLTYFAWVPALDPISHMSEQLVLKHNPDWQAHSWDGKVLQTVPWEQKDFPQAALLIHDEPLKFTREIWCGRWRALRGIGATLSPEQVQAFDQEHDALLKAKFGDEFIVPHRIVTRVFQAI